MKRRSFLDILLGIPVASNLLGRPELNPKVKKVTQAMEPPPAPPIQEELVKGPSRIMLDSGGSSGAYTNYMSQSELEYWQCRAKGMKP